MTTDRDALIEAAVAVMVREGGRLAEWHGWRCSYPGVYGECECNREVAAEVIDAVLPLIAGLIERWVEPDPLGDWSRGMLDAGRLVRSLALTDQ